jgi:hypothetical protein
VTGGFVEDSPSPGLREFLKGTEMEVFLITFFSLALVFAFCASVVAVGKNRSGFGWFILGGLFGLFGLIAIIFMPRKEAQ